MGFRTLHWLLLALLVLHALERPLSCQAKELEGFSDEEVEAEAEEEAEERLPADDGDAKEGCESGSGGFRGGRQRKRGCEETLALGK